jgi:hypothetical protein
MCSPISGTIVEIFLQHLEHIHIRPLIVSKQILFYTRYIDNILISYDIESTSQDNLTQLTNSIHTDLQFNVTRYSNGYIKFLDLTIIRKTSHLETYIHRKITATDTTIHFTCANCNEHKLAVYRHYTERLLNQPLYAARQKNRMFNSSSHSPAKRFHTYNSTNLRHRIKHKKAHHNTHKHEQKQKMSNIRLRYPTNT